MKSVVPEDNARGKLFYAFLELIEKKPYSKIKVSELIEKAGVNRSTFYRYYSDIYDFFDRICSSGLYYATSGLDECAAKGDLESGLNDFYDVLSSRIDIFADVAKKVTGKNGSLLFVKSFRGYLIDRLEDAFSPSSDEDYFLILYYADAIYFRLLSAVCEKGDILSAEENEFRYSPDIGILQNIVNCISLNGSEIYLRLMKSAANMFLTREPRALNVNNITTFAKVSRTEFYNFFGNIPKMVKEGMNAAFTVAAQVLFTCSFCDESEFETKTPPLDLEDMLKTDGAVELASHHREYYAFLSDTRSLLIRLIKKHLLEKDFHPNEAQNRELEFYGAWATMCFINCAEETNAVDFRQKMHWAKNRLEEKGIRL